MKKILVVEDDLVYLKLLHDQLIAKGYQVIQAQDGKQGLDAAKREKPDLILMDMRMPVMDGMTMLGLLRQNEDTKSTKVIILTNYEPDEKLIQAAVVYKPLNYFVKTDTSIEDLFKKVSEATY